MQAILTVLLILFLGSLGCREEANNDDEIGPQEDDEQSTDTEPSHGYTETQPWGPSSPVTYVDEEPLPGETLTQARTRALTNYATALVAAWDPTLLDSFSRRDVVGEPLSASYIVRVEGGSCFNEERRLGSDHDIKKQKDVDALIRQINYTVEFLARLHDDANGYPNRFFDTLSLCPSRKIEADLLLHSHVLYVGVGIRFGSIRTANAFEIRDSWARGKHLKKYYSKLQSLWWLLDPVGTPRLLLRDAITDGAHYLSERLDEVLNEPNEERARARLIDIMEAHIIPTYEESEGVNFRTSALSRVKTLDIVEIQMLTEEWQAFIENPEAWEGMSDAVTVTHQATATNAYDIDLDQFGLIVVGNFHNITLDIGIFLPRNRDFVRYVTIEQVEQSISVRQRGLVCVYTIDNIEVNLAVSADRGVETAGLEHALDLI